MKKILLFAILFSLFAGFNSCSNDEENNEPFVWEGDIEGYNPLLGDWRWDGTDEGLRFSEDKKLYRIDYGTVTVPVGPFEINHKAYKTKLAGITRYKIVNEDKFIQYPNQNNDDNSSVLIRVK